MRVERLPCWGSQQSRSRDVAHYGGRRRHDTDTESLATVEEAQSNESTDGGGRDGVSAFEGDHPDPVEELAEQFPDLQLPHIEAFTRGLLSLVEVDLETIFRRRPIIVRFPTFLKGAFRRALVLAMDEALAGLAVWTNQDRSGLGNSSCCCHVCSSTVPPEVVWSRRPNSENVLPNLPQAGGTVCWRRVSQELRRGSDLARRKRRREQDKP